MFLLGMETCWNEPKKGELVNYRQPIVIFGGRVMDTLGLGQTIGKTFLPKSKTGFKESFFASGAVSKEFMLYYNKRKYF